MQEYGLALSRCTTHEQVGQCGKVGCDKPSAHSLADDEWQHAACLPPCLAPKGAAQGQERAAGAVDLQHEALVVARRAVLAVGGQRGVATASDGVEDAIRHRLKVFPRHSLAPRPRLQRDAPLVMAASCLDLDAGDGDIGTSGQRACRDAELQLRDLGIRPLGRIDDDGFHPLGPFFADCQGCLVRLLAENLHWWQLVCCHAVRHFILLCRHDV